MRPGIEARHTPDAYDPDGNARQRRVCRFPDSKSLKFASGKEIAQYHNMVVSSPNTDEDECVRVEALVLDNAGIIRVGLGMCALQLACGECPRGFAPEKAKELK